jgi:hypothetical protein
MCDAREEQKRPREIGRVKGEGRYIKLQEKARRKSERMMVAMMRQEEREGRCYVISML